MAGITTTADPDGSRAGYVAYLLSLAGRSDIPVAAGASLAGNAMGDLPAYDRYWGASAVTHRPSPEGTALELMTTSIEHGATVIGIGPYTNLALLEATRPGMLGLTSVVLMGGWVQPPTDGFPTWGPEMDWNVQCDTTAAVSVFEAVGDLTLVTLPATLKAHLRASHLGRLKAAGPVGRLLACQGRAHSDDYQMTRLARAHSGLPDDLLNFQYDPVACAVALGWSGATISSMNLRPRLDDGVLRFESAQDGKSTAVVLDVDGPGFAETWLSPIERVNRRW